MHLYHFGKESNLLKNFEDWAVFEIELVDLVDVINTLGIDLLESVYSETNANPTSTINEESTPYPSSAYCHINLGFSDLNISPSIEEGFDHLCKAIKSNSKSVRIFFSGELEIAHELDLINHDQYKQFQQNVTLIENYEDLQ